MDSKYFTCIECPEDAMEVVYKDYENNNAVSLELLKGSEADEDAVWLNLTDVKELHKYLTDLLPIMAEREMKLLLGI